MKISAGNVVLYGFQVWSMHVWREYAPKHSSKPNMGDMLLDIQLEQPKHPHNGKPRRYTHKQRKLPLTKHIVVITWQRLRNSFNKTQTYAIYQRMMKGRKGRYKFYIICVSDEEKISRLRARPENQTAETKNQPK